MSDDLISRQAAIDALCNDYCGGHQDCKYYPNCENLRSVQKLPSAQPEIVRCKDCKYAEYIDDVQTLWCTECGQGRTVAPDDFCSYGEKERGGQDG